MSQDTTLPDELVRQIEEIGRGSNTQTLLLTQGATIAAAHYQDENKRLVELLKKLAYAKWINMSTDEQYIYKCQFDTYWLQYCKGNGIKGE